MNINWRMLLRMGKLHNYPSNEGGCNGPHNTNTTGGGFHQVTQELDGTRPTMGNEEGFNLHGLQQNTEVQGFSHRYQHDFNGERPVVFIAQCLTRCSQLTTRARTPQAWADTRTARSSATQRSRQWQVNAARARTSAAMSAASHSRVAASQGRPMRLTGCPS